MTAAERAAADGGAAERVVPPAIPRDDRYLAEILGQPAALRRAGAGLV